jgi:hypothetical protein
MFEKQCYFGEIFYVAKVVDDPQENLAKFGYKLKYEVIKKEHPFIFLATYLNHVYEYGDLKKLDELALLKISQSS